MIDFKTRVKWPLVILWAGRRVIMPITFVFAVVGTAALTVLGVEMLLAMQVAFFSGLFLTASLLLGKVGVKPPARLLQSEED